MAMNLETVSYPNPILTAKNVSLSALLFNSHIPTIHTSKTILHPNSASGFHNKFKRVANLPFCSNCPYFSHSHLPLEKRTKHDIPNSSRFNFGFCNTGKNVSCNCIVRFGKCSGALRVRCGGELGEREDDEDGYYMRRAVELASQAVGCTSPNPMVGCVIVKDGEIVGEGFHPKAGQPHAEVFALMDAGELAENATVYVSLEPCNHYGRTPPCTEALIQAKVNKVVIGMVDPNPIVASKGVNRLRDAGIEVIVGVEEDLCKKLNEAYIHKMLTGNPFVTLRFSVSVNGLVLDQLGEEAMESGGYYSKLLQECDAIIHSSTAIEKELSFPASQEPKANQPLHILVAKDPASPISIPNSVNEIAWKAIIFTDKEMAATPKTAKLGIEIVSVDQMSFDAILEYCNKQGSCSVLLDVRGKLDDFEEIMKEAFEKNLLQKVVVEVLPLWIGGEEIIPLQLTTLTQRVGLRKLSTRTSGKNVLLEGYF
ncbi:hypothetical protein Ancab_037857 [Ancistrocladus abbreviatus]